MFPTDPAKFKGTFCFHYIEDENGHIPKPYEHLIGNIPLHVEVADDQVILSGKVSPYKADCYNLRINNHNYGLYLDVTCVNRNEQSKNKVIWRRVLSKKQLVVDNVMEVEGDAPDVPLCNPSTAQLTTVKRMSNVHIDSVRVVIDLKTYDQFVHRHFEE